MPLQRANNSARASSDKINNRKKVISAVLPIFQKEDLEGHARYLIERNSEIREAVERDPRNYQLLKDEIAGRYEKAGKYLFGAKLIDSWDRATSLAGLASEAAVGPGQVVSAGEELVELAPKALYWIYYAAKTGDYSSLPYFALYEAASFVPVLGDIFVDMRNIYVDRAREQFRREVKKSFLEKIVQGFSKGKT